MGDRDRDDLADWDFLNEFAAEPISRPDPEPPTERPPPRRWSTEEKARIVRESFWPGAAVGDVADRHGVSRKQLSAWRTLARRGKLVLPSPAEPEAVAVPGPEPAFATLEVDETSASERGSVGSVSIEARGVTVRLDGDIGAGRIAEIASLLRSLR
ncbi:MAG: transposase [Rhodospirillales bacterium]|nr:transposase [Rhodospirillales bacterium]